MLARKGYGSGLAFSVVRDELASAGRDEPAGAALHLTGGLPATELPGPRLRVGCGQGAVRADDEGHNGRVPPEEPVHVVVLDRGRELSGVVHEGESWAAAARRTCASMHAEPEPVDLSGEVKRFVVDHDTRIAIRAMTRGDLDDVVAWRTSHEVQRWWSPGELGDADQIAAKYAERIDGMSPTRMWVVEVNGRSVGFVQDYRIGDYPDYAVLGPDPDAIGVDYAIGSDLWRGRGLGQRMLWAWMQRARTPVPGGHDVLRRARPPQRRVAAGAGQGGVHRGAVVRRAAGGRRDAPPWSGAAARCRPSGHRLRP